MDVYQVVIVLLCIGANFALHVQKRSSETGFTQTEINDFVATINKWRRTDAGVTASNMYEVTWDDNLAKDAMSWASTCKYYHGQPASPAFGSSDVGQNIGYVTGNGSKVLTVFTAWMNERFYYDYDSGTCYYDPCLHYTEMMWHDHHKVGCATYNCTNVFDKNGVKSELDMSPKMLVCNYSPAGNKPTKPWNTGTPCSECHLCHNNLCATPEQCKPAGSLDCQCTLSCKHCGTVTSDCKCDCPAGTYGDECQFICRNERPECATYSASKCNDGTAEGTIIYNDCKVLCGRCTENKNTAWTCGSETHANVFAKFGRTVQYGYANSTGSKCVFPFLYDGEYRDKCIGTSTGYGSSAWCSLTSNYDIYKTKLTGCTAVTTDKTDNCAFPFIYGGKYYQKCLKDGSKYWCGTTENYDADQKWAWCSNIDSENNKVSR